MRGISFMNGHDDVQVLKGASESAAALPEVKGWHTNISTSTGRLYYINGLTGWSTYDTPTVTAADDLRQAGWESFLSSDTGCRYFHCLETGECTYDVPACPYDEEDILEDDGFDRGNTRQFPPEEEEELCCAADASASFDPNGGSFEVGQHTASHPLTRRYLCRLRISLGGSMPEPPASGFTQLTSAA